MLKADMSIQKLGKIVEQAKADAPFYVMPRFKNKYDVMEMVGPQMVDYCHFSLLSQDEAEDLCERLNNEYIAMKVIEATML